jgi:hypothetical protein
MKLVQQLKPTKNEKKKTTVLLSYPISPGSFFLAFFVPLQLFFPGDFTLFVLTSAPEFVYI